MKRVLQVIGIVCGGGVEAVIMNYYRNIDRTQLQFDFVVDGYEKTYLDDEIEKMGGHVYHVEPYRKNIFRYMKQIYKIVREGQYEIVHSNMNTLSVFSLFPAWLAGAEQRILHNHSTAVKQEGKRSLMKKILRPLAPVFANRYAACSELAGNWMYGKEKMKNGDITIIRNAIDLEAYAFSKGIRAKYRQELGIATDDFVIGHVGRFMFQKNHTFLVEIFREVKSIQHNAVLLLIGDGELRGKIEKQVQEYGLTDSVKFLGLRNDVQGLYNAMDVFVLPSWYEGLPVVSVEAQANGLRSIFSTNVTAESGLTRSSEFICLEDGVNVWSEKILQNNSYRNPNAKEEMKQAGFDIKAQARNLIDWYKQI